MEWVGISVETVRFDGSSVDLVVVSPRNGFVEALKRLS